MLPELSDVEMLLLYTGAVLAVMFILLSWVGRRVGGRANSAVRAVIPVTSQHRLHVVDVDGRRLLVGTGPQGAPSLVCELGDEPAWTREPTVDGEWSRTRVLPHGGRPYAGDGVPSVHGR